MEPPAEHSAHPSIRALATRQPIKVWSWLTTIFGDLAREPDEEVSGIVLGALTVGIGIRPEAMRVALHRLRKDGWIETRRAGRTSHYRLSEHGLAETLRASARIYARQAESASVWHLVMIDPAGAAQPQNERSVAITPYTTLRMGPRQVNAPDALVADVPANSIPDWIIRAAIPPEVDAGYRALSALLDEIEGIASEPLGALDTVLLRLLTVHHWRRALLRHSPVLGALCEDRWIGTQCRIRSHALLECLPRPMAAHLAETIAKHT